MRIESNIETLASIGGIEAITVADGGIYQNRGDASWFDVLRAAIMTHRLASVPESRVNIGAFTIVVQTEGREVAAVMMPVGHPFMKSVRRTLRRAAKGRIKAKGMVER